jgi:hypothetical protein
MPQNRKPKRQIQRSSDPAHINRRPGIMDGAPQEFGESLRSNRLNREEKRDAFAIIAYDIYCDLI